MEDTNMTVTLTGNTFPVRAKLKCAGWTWLPLQLSWQKQYPAGTLLADMRATHRGCRVAIDGTTAWTSKTYVAPVTGVGAWDSEEGLDEDTI